MDKVLNIKQATEIANSLHQQGEKIVLTGGCFDILHIGHVSFLKQAKKQGSILFVLLESDSKIKSMKGKNRPVNSQTDRAVILSELSVVDYVVILPDLTKNNEYDAIIKDIKPDIIATTKGDPNIFHKQRQVKIIGAKLAEVIDRISDQSTTRLSKILLTEI